MIKNDLLLCSCITEEGSAVRKSQSNVVWKGLWEAIWPSSLPRSGHLMAEILPVVTKESLSFWLNFSMLFSPLLYAADNYR